jgi:2-hydroxy-3-keto-5-methylthiopentenyl-1-phosphate phosphatase
MHDVAEHLLEEFGDPSWPIYDEAWERGAMGAVEGLQLQAEMLHADTATMLDHALRHCPIDPTFPPFVSHCTDEGVPVTLVSDGFGFYIEPLLERAGLEGLPVITNDWFGGRLEFGNGHPGCVGCGTCKMRAVLEAPGPVAFVGEGLSDRFGALYSDVVFAKDALVGFCKGAGVLFRPWSDFDDVWRSLSSGEPIPGPVAPVRCPGWMDRFPRG